MEFKANECLTVSTSGSAQPPYISAKLLASVNNDGMIDATMNYYTDSACSVGIKTSMSLSNQAQGTCETSSGYSFEYTSIVTSPKDGFFTKVFAGSCDTMIYGQDMGINWGFCLGGNFIYTGCNGTELYGVYYPNGCGGTGNAAIIPMNICDNRNDDNSFTEEDDDTIGSVTLPLLPYDKDYWECNQAPSNDDDDDVCFAGSETLLLDSGERVSMENVSLGDRVQVAATDGTLQYADVIALPHVKNNREASFVELVTATGSLKTTPLHLVMAGACDNIMSMKLIRANDVPLGSCLATSEGSTEVTAILMTKGYGVYSVVTSHADGLLVVNDFKASSFAINHSLVNAYYHVHRALYLFAPSLIKCMTSISATLGALGATIVSI